MTTQELAEAAYATDIAIRHVDREVHALCLARTAPNRLDTIASVIHEAHDHGAAAAIAEYDEIPEPERDALVQSATETVQRHLLVSAHVCVETAKTLHLDPDNLSADYVALFAASPVGWSRWYGEIERAA